MKIKKSILFLLFALIFASCSDNDIDDLNNKYDKLLEEQIRQAEAIKNHESLLTALQNKLTVDKVEPIENGYKIVFSDNTTVNITNGHTPVFTLGDNGNWFIDGEDSGVKAEGKDGQSGSTPTIEDGYWYIDGESTGVKAQPEDGISAPTIISIVINDSVAVFTFSDNSQIKVPIKDETINYDLPEIIFTVPVDGIETDMMQWLRISAEVKNGKEESYKWILNDEVIGSTNELLHLFAEPGTYEIEFTAKNEVGVSSKAIHVTVNEQTYQNKITKVYEFLPAPGQFVNTMPQAIADDDAESMLDKANEVLTNGGMVSLGGFGGYVTFGFDHTVINREGNDFVVLGNAMPNSAEPGVIMVSYDSNGNGLPDDEWYEIEGSQYPAESTIKEYEMTYYKPTEEPADPNEPNYIRWTDNQGNEGYIAKNNFHRQPYYPMWAGQSVTYKGTYLAATMYDESGNGTMWKSPAYEFGYADNWANNDERAQIDIDWAVDKEGNKVHLKGIDFVRVHTSTRAAGGWLGEVSTEVSGFKDLNLN